MNTGLWKTIEIILAIVGTGVTVIIAIVDERKMDIKIDEGIKKAMAELKTEES